MSPLLILIAFGAAVAACLVMFGIGPFGSARETHLKRGKNTGARKMETPAPSRDKVQFGKR